MQTAAGLAVCCCLLQTAVDRIFDDKYFDHMGMVASTTKSIKKSLL
jgi:hypothetical protein